MDSFLQRQVSAIRQLHKTHPNVIIDHLNEIVSFLNTIQTQTDGLHVLTIISNELSSTNVLRLLNNADLMKHEFFILIGRTFEMLLTKSVFIQMTKQDEQCFYELSHFIVSLCLYTDKNEIFLTKTFYDKLHQLIIDDLVINDYEPYHVKYKVMNRLLDLFIELNDNFLIDPICQCIRSDYYLNSYETINLRESMINPKQYFFIYQCPLFICRCGYQKQDYVSNSLCPFIFEYTRKVFQQHLTIALEGESVAKQQAIVWHIQLLNHLALTPVSRIYFITGMSCSIDALGIYPTIVDQMFDILRTESLIRIVHKNSEEFDADVGLMASAITLLYNLSFDGKIFSLLKEKNTLELCAKLHKAKDRRIQFASQTLSVILNEETMEKLNNPSNIVGNYLFYIQNTIDELSQTYHGIKLEGVLANLEIIVQNDFIKEQVANDDDGISLLARCVLDQNFDFDTIQYPALRILDAVSFGSKKACQKMKDNDKLMDYVKHLSVSNDSCLEAIANRIRWKIEDEKEFILKQTKFVKNENIQLNSYWDLPDSRTSNMFDLMISYHRNDQNICYQIYDRLTASNAYRVSFDREHLHERLPNIMAQTIENSSIVLICFSSDYQKSHSCRLEAEYAEKRKRTIIPVKLDELYHPNGWLNNIIANRRCIHLTASNLNHSCANIIQQIDQIKNQLL